jgi:alpha-mannosidase
VLRIEMDIDWNESRRLLRVEYPATVNAPSAVCGTQFGFIERPTHRNTSWDRARFEFPAHRFVSLGQPGRGLAVLAADIHGFSCLGSTIGASLLRSPVHPDPLADRGTHRLTLGLCPHTGDWRESDVSNLAERFARPLRAVGRSQAARPLAWQTDGSSRIELSALLPDEANPGCTLARFVEVEGGEGTIRITGPENIGAITRTDALGKADLEQHGTNQPIHVCGGQILTLRIQLDR